MPLISDHHGRTSRSRVKSHVLPRPCRKASELTHKWAVDLETYVPPSWSHDTLTMRPFSKIGRFTVEEGFESSGSSSSGSYLSHSPPTPLNAPLNLRAPIISRGRLAVDMPLLQPPPAGAPAHIIACLKKPGAEGFLNVWVDGRLEIKRHNGQPYASPLYFSQYDGAAMAFNTVVKRFYSTRPNATRDAFGTRIAKDTWSDAKRQFDIGQRLGNAFAPLYITTDNRETYLEAPLAKASLSDGIRQIFGRHGSYGALHDKSRHDLQKWLAWRVVSDLLPQLDKLATLGVGDRRRDVTHNNIRPSNILMDGDGHFHLSGLGAASVVGRPKDGDWANKRPEAVIHYGIHDTRKSDLWAMGKVFVRLMIMPFGQHPDDMNRQWEETDPFRPNYVYHSENNINGIQFADEIASLPENLTEAATLHSVWTKLYGDFRGWYDRKNMARKKSIDFNEPWPRLRKFESASARQHAERIYPMFKALSRLDFDSNCLRFALEVFNPNEKQTISANKLYRSFGPVFNNLFKPKDAALSFLSHRCVAPPPLPDPTVVVGEPDTVPPEVRRRQLRHQAVEKLLAEHLGRVEGEGMRLCNARSSNHIVRSPSPKRARLEFQDV